QRPADDPCKLRQPPADAAEARLLDRADIDDGLSIGKTLGEAPPDRQRQTAPLLVGQQIVEAAVVEQDGVRGGRFGKPWYSSGRHHTLLLCPSALPGFPRRQETDDLLAKLDQR